MADILTLPLDRITRHDERRLEEAAAGSPFDLAIERTGTGRAVPYLLNCGEEVPAYRLEKSGGAWQAISLEGAVHPAPVATDATPAGLLKRLWAKPVSSQKGGL